MSAGVFLPAFSHPPPRWRRPTRAPPTAPRPSSAACSAAPSATRSSTASSAAGHRRAPLCDQARAGAGGQHLPARGEPAGPDRAQLFRLPGRDADGVLGANSRAAIGQYQAFLGYPPTGVLTEYEKVFLTSSYQRAIVGGTAGGADHGRERAGEPRPAARLPPGADGRPRPRRRRRCRSWRPRRRPRRLPRRSSSAGAPAPAPAEPAPPPRRGPRGGCRGRRRRRPTAAAELPARRRLRRRSTATATASASRQAATAASSPPRRCATRCRRSASSSAWRAPMPSSRATASRARSGLLDGRDGGAVRRLRAEHGRLPGPARVAGPGRGPRRAPGLRRLHRRGAGADERQRRICLGIGYHTDNAEVALAAALVLVGLGEEAYGELLGHHLMNGFATPKRPDRGVEWLGRCGSGARGGAARWWRTAPRRTPPCCAGGRRAHRRRSGAGAAGRRRRPRARASPCRWCPPPRTEAPEPTLRALSGPGALLEAPPVRSWRNW